MLPAMRGGWVRRLGRVVVGTLLLAVTSACTGQRETPVVDAGSGAPGELAASMDARVRGDTVVFTLHVSNPTSSPVRLAFTSSQRFDFEVGTLTGESVWHWSADRSFMQVLGEEILRAGETVDYRAEWVPTRPGEYYVRGRVVSTNQPVELRTSFEVPVR